MCTGSQRYISGTEAEKRGLVKTLEMKRVTISAFTVFVRHGLLQHARVEWEGSFRLR